MFLRRTARPHSRRLRFVTEPLEPRTLLAAVSWDGGGGDLNWNNRINWSTDTLPGPADDVVIDVAGALPTITIAASASAGRIVSQEPVAVTGTGTTLSVDHIEVPSLSLSNDSVLTTTSLHRLEVDVSGTLWVDVESSIDVSGKGYLVGRTTGNTTIGASTAGASYGGLGRSPGGFVNATYGDYADPDDWGSGGSSGDGNGGGLVRVTAGELRLDGRLLADGGYGGYGGPSYFGGGSGGGIYVEVQNLRGQGQIRAAGGASEFNGGPGGGGRVAVYAIDHSGFDLGNVTAPGGPGLPSLGAGAGTVFVKDSEPVARLIIDNSSATGAGGVTPLGVAEEQIVSFNAAVVLRGDKTTVRPAHAAMTLEFARGLRVEGSARLDAADATVRFPASSAMVVGSGGFVEIPGTLNSAGPVTVDAAILSASRIIAPSLSVVNGGKLTTLPASSTQVHKLEVSVAGTLWVDVESSIDVSGKGYLVGRTTGNTTVGASTGGASYGGLGRSPGGFVNATYGDYADPDDWGSGGSSGDGNGGGLVRVTAGELRLDGRLLADGGYGGYGGPSYFGGGSGGGIYVEVQTLRGQGQIRAAGGGSEFNGGPGGGGRVAVYGQDLSGFNISHITAPGGTNSTPNGLGTVHVVQGRRGAHVRSVSPAGINGDYVNEAVDHVTLVFNKPIVPLSFSTDDLFIDARGRRISPTSVESSDGLSFRVGFPQQTENGTYVFVLATSIIDAEGFALDQDADGTPGEVEDSYSVTLTIDTVAPSLATHIPAGDVSGTLNFIDVLFSERIDAKTFTPTDVSIAGPGGPISPASVTERGFNRYRIAFAAQTAEGQYQVQIGPDVADLAGNRMLQTASFGVNLVPLDLGITSLNVFPARLVAGEPITISWSGVNHPGTQLLGDWTDGVYLSADDRWDINDLLLAEARHTGGLDAGQPYPGSATVIVPGVLPRDYHILVRSDIRNDQRETVETDNAFASPPVSVTVRQLTDGTASGGTVTPGDRADYFAIDVAPGASIGVALDVLSAGGFSELYVSRGSIPTRQSFALRSVKTEADVNRSHHELAATAPAAGGTYYVLVYGDAIEGPAANYNITAATGAVIVTSITPDHHGTAAPADITVRGAGFDETTTVQLIDSNGRGVDASNVQVVSSSSLAAHFSLAGLAAGVYDVRVTKGDASDTLSNAFTVLPGGSARLETNLVVPSAVGFNIPIRQTIWIEYRNAGNLPMQAPFLKLNGTFGARLTADPLLAVPHAGMGKIAGLSDTVQVLGVGHSATPWTLLPGESGRLPIYYLGLSESSHYANVTFILATLEAGDSRPIDWSAQERLLRPAGLTDDDWADQFAAVKAWFGQTWGAYISRVNESLRRWFQLTDHGPSDVRELYRFSVQLMHDSNNAAQAGDITDPVQANVAAAAPSNPLDKIRAHDITSPYGWRSFDNFDHIHQGIDIYYPVGTPLTVLTPDSAWVSRYRDFSGSAGYNIEFTDSTGSWKYFHLDSSTATSDQSGPGSHTVAISGNSGPADTPEHLHLERLAGGSPLERLKEYYVGVAPAAPSRRAGDGALNNTTVHMVLAVNAPSWDLSHVTVTLVSVNGNNLAQPRNFGGVSVDGPNPYNLFHDGDHVWELNLILSELDPLNNDPCEPDGSWTFKVTSYTYDDQFKESEIQYFWHPVQTQESANQGDCDDDDGIPDPPVVPGPSGTVRSVGSGDPNDKVGPIGVGDSKSILDVGVIGYQIRFENKSDATAPAREITVTDLLDDALDLSTLELVEIAFANQRLTVPSGLRNFETTVSLQVNLTTQLLVEVHAALDGRTLRLTLGAVDQVTGFYPEDPLLGLLYPNDSTGRGEGSISYIVRPKAGLPTGTVIRNKATIVFDYNDPIDTPEVFNTIDAAGPTSRVEALPASSPGGALLRWTGEDDAGGSGVQSYDIYVSEDGGPFRLLFPAMTATSAPFSGRGGHTYTFYSLARDNVGHVEAPPAAPDATTTVTSAVAGVHVFYNHGRSDGNDAAAAASDDAAIARDKRPLQQGETAGFVNYTTYSRGLNGVMVDVASLASPEELTAADFELSMGDGTTWTPAPLPTLTVRPGAGLFASDRVTLVLPDGVLRNTWLRIKILSNIRTGLSAPETYYYGNLVGDTGNDRGTPVVNTTDVARTRAAVGRNDAASLNRYDFNRDGRIDASDVLIVRNNQRHTLPLFTAPSSAPASPAAATGDVTIPTPLRGPTRPPRRSLFDPTVQDLLA